MKLIKNPYRGSGRPEGVIETQGDVRSDASAGAALLKLCPVAKTTPLVGAPDLAIKLGVGSISVKDERTRMGLGSFKALGAAFVIAKRAAAKLGDEINDPEKVKTVLAGEVFTAATAGNHGLSVAAGARIFGARAVIFIAETVPEDFVVRLAEYGAEVVREGAEYAASLNAAQAAAEKNGWQLLSDTSWPGYSEIPLDVMEGYLAMAAEAAEQFGSTPPTHIFLQAGVGGLASATAVYARKHWGEDFEIIVVEPSAAPALQASIEAGKSIVTEGPISNMGRLDCKEPSQLALKALARDADGYLTVTDEYVQDAIEDLAGVGLETSPSGGAGYAGLKALRLMGHAGLDANSRVLLYLSEGPSGD